MGTFASMPEQYIGLKEMINKQVEVAQPVLTEEHVEQMNFTLIEALRTSHFKCPSLTN